MQLEIVAYSYASAAAAHAGGADRVELCENTAEGGTTPSLGTIEAARALPGLRLHVMVRPRGGDFLYTDAEFRIMLREVAIAKAAGADGVVFGLLKPDATVDIERTRALVQAAAGMSVTFHRAFDWAADPTAALEAIIAAGCHRVLTSGQAPNALAGAVLLLLPLALVTIATVTHDQRTSIRVSALGTLGLLGLGGLVWSGSKSGWLIALGMVAIGLLRFPWGRRWASIAIPVVLVLGLAAFGLRFERYFRQGATSVGARMDYWRAAVQATSERPLTGTGPGTFQRPYARLKSPEAEMARLVHNDYLEQFSDSGIPGGIAYLAWILAWLLRSGRSALMGVTPCGSPSPSAARHGCARA